MQETKCCMCGRDVRATDDDEAPTCEPCQALWAEAQAVQAIMDGELDHLIPELQEGGED